MHALVAVARAPSGKERRLADDCVELDVPTR